MYIILAILALALLILVHESGHFLAAKMCGIYVERFSLGFGKVIWSRTKGETEYCVSLVPLGGYVKLHRMLEEEDPVEGKESKAFFNKSYPVKLFVITAGILFNLIFAVLLLGSVYMVGYKAHSPVVGEVAAAGIAEAAGIIPGDRILSINGESVRSWEEMSVIMDESSGALSLAVERGGETVDVVLTPEMVDYTMPTGETVIVADAGMNAWIEPVVGGLSIGYPAEKAGVEQGDRIVSISGQPVNQWQDISAALREMADVPAEIVVERGSEQMRFEITPQLNPDTGYMIIGVMATSGDVTLRQNPLDSLKLGLERTWMVVKAIYQSLWDLVTGKVSRENLGGPILIVQEGARSAESGYEMYIAYIALISINLAILNFLPIPILDGGYAIMFTYEAVTRRKVSANARVRGQQIGFLFLGLLMIFAFYNDITRFFN